MALSYYDVYLEKEDMLLLHGPHWLNDQVTAVPCATHGGLTALPCPACGMALPGGGDQSLGVVAPPPPLDHAGNLFCL